MREILFRGKPNKHSAFVGIAPDEYSKKWIYGSFLDVENCSIYQQGDYGLDIISHGIINVLKNTICEYTGQTDINGVKIFENDILHCHSKYNKELDKKCVVRYVGSGFYLDDMVSEGMLEDSVDNMYETFTYEVIGNIFDNSELVEELENECKAKHEKPSTPC